MNKNIEKISDIIKNISGSEINPSKLEKRINSRDSKDSKIEEVIIFSSQYDYFMLEEDGRLEQLIKQKFSNVRFGKIPSITHVSEEEECKKELKNREIDLLIFFNDPTESGIMNFLDWCDNNFQGSLSMLIKNDPNLIEEYTNSFKNRLDGIFTWSGDGKIVLAIVQYFEDQYRLQKPKKRERGRAILVLEDSIQYYSSILTKIYEEIWKYLEDIMEDISFEEKQRKYKRRPFVLLAKSFDEAIGKYEDFENEIIGIVSDYKLTESVNDQSRTGLDLIREIKKRDRNLPIILQSSEKLDTDLDLIHIQKNSPKFNKEIENFTRQILGPTEIDLEDIDGKEFRKIKNLKELEELIFTLSPDKIKKVLEKDLYGLLSAQCEFELAESVEYIKNEYEKDEELKKKIISAIEERQYAVHQSEVEDFSRKKIRSDKIQSIGTGSIGGKARGLAFTAKLFNRYLPKNIFEKLNITVPRTIVLSTDVFEKFLENNGLNEPYIFELSDERIASKFMEGNLPPTVIGDIRSFVRETRNPLIVRSSGVLEDSMLEPFAGIYSSITLPNMSWETDQRFREVCNSIKYVYASTFFEEARDYLKSTSKNIGDEKMGIILQEVVGKKRGKYFYPSISGVAKSYNHYPPEGVDPEEGIVYLALGLGKEIVEGGNSYFFSPKRPKKPLFGTPKDFLDNSQKEFFALDLEEVYREVNKSEEATLKRLDLQSAEKHGVLKKVASTYSYREDRLYPGVNRKGARIIDFGPIIKYGSLPLPKAIKLLLEVMETTLGYPVEIEFCVEFSEENGKAELNVLQVRSMMSKDLFIDIDIEDYRKEDLVCFSQNALGYGVFEEIRDIIYVDRNEFQMKNSQNVVEKIKSINKKLIEQEKEYILIGPGRWGSKDSWLGIPVKWGDIAGAKVIIETQTKGRNIDFSQGSHFFHDMIGSETAYFMLKDKRDDLDWDWIENQSLKEDKGEIKHVRCEEPLEVKIDGKERKGVIIRKID